VKKKILNVILLNLTVFFALISIHEISHLVIGRYLSCDYERIVLLDKEVGTSITGMLFNEPYTELICSSGTNQFFLYMGSFFVTSLFGLMFLSLNSPGKNMFFVIMGLSLVFSSFDISLATNIESIIYPVIGSGFIFMILGEYFIASAYVKEDALLDLFGMHEIEETS
jgi:hypothetical protein